jgi:hypothetical protein
MARGPIVQRDFSGGEISSRMLMRADTEVYGKSALQMVNWFPTLQGSMERCPGSRFVYEIVNKSTARLIPYITPDNKRGFVELTPGGITIRTGYVEILSSYLNKAQVTATGIIRKNILFNPRFRLGTEGWVLTPPEYVGNDGAKLGCWWGQYPGARDGFVRLSPRIYKNPADIATCTVTTSCQVTAPTDSIDIAFLTRYVNAIPFSSEYTYTLKITSGFDTIFDYEFKGEPGTVWEGITRANLPTLGWTGQLDIEFSHTARQGDDPYSHPVMEIQILDIFANVEADINTDIITGTPPWTAAELDEVQYVQSPYGYPSGRKELVLVHPNYPPHWLYFNGSNYVLEEIPFNRIPSGWSTENYPAACTSFMGRLILAGSNYRKLDFSNLTSNTETVWGTEVGKWAEFSDPLSTEVNPDDSIEFTAIYRSPIQWVYGQKDLLVGATEMEYVASADGIFSPGDLGVFMQSTHGSSGVQPAGFGDVVMFPAEAGTKVRAMSASNQDQGFISTDMTLLTPELCSSGIRRMVRMRNPHQMCVCLLNNGQLALFHYDRQAGISGWSRYNMSVPVLDICVVTNNDGVDILFMVTARYVQNVRKIYVEALADWTENRTQLYMSCSSLFAPDNTSQTNVIPNVDHLEGYNVQVITDGNYVGTFPVVNGQIELYYPNGDPILFNIAACGLAFRSQFQSLPVASQDPGDVKRRITVSVRTRGSTRPVINDQRPADRNPITLMDRSQYLDLITDLKVANFGSDIYQIVEIEESLPYRSEILGLYGTVTTNSVS